MVAGCLAILPGQVKSAEIVADWSFDNGSPFVMDISPDGQYILIGDTSGRYRLFHSDTNATIITGSQPWAISNVSISADGKTIAVVWSGDFVSVQTYSDSYVSRTGFINFWGGKGANVIEVSEDGAYIALGFTNTINFEFMRLIGHQTASYSYDSNGGTTGVPSDIVMSGNGEIVVQYRNLSSNVDAWWGKANFGISTNPDQWLHFNDPDAGHIQDVEMDYSGRVIIAGSTSGKFGEIGHYGWEWHVEAPSSITDVAVSRDGKVVAALDESHNLYYVYENRSHISIPTTFTDIQLTQHGEYLICSDSSGSTGLTIYDSNLDIVAQNNAIGFFDDGTLQIGYDGRHIYGRIGNVLHHIKFTPSIELNYIVEYTAGGYEHVNSTTLFTLESHGTSKNSLLYYEIDGKGWVTYSGPFNLTGLVEGPHIIRFYLADANGYNIASEQIEVWLDPYGIFDEIEARLAMLEWSIADIWNTMDTLNTTIAGLNASLNITSIQENITGLWENNSLNQQDIATIQNQIASLTGNTTSLFQNITTTINRIHSLEANGTLTNQNIITILSRLATLNTALANVTSDAAILSSTVSALETGHNSTKESIASLRANITALDKSISETGTILNQINTDLDEIGSDVENNSDGIVGVNSALFGAYALATLGLILGIIGLALGLISFRRKEMKSGKASEPPSNDGE